MNLRFHMMYRMSQIVAGVGFTRSIPPWESWEITAGDIRYILEICFGRCMIDLGSLWGYPGAFGQPAFPQNTTSYKKRKNLTFLTQCTSSSILSGRDDVVQKLKTARGASWPLGIEKNVNFAINGAMGNDSLDM